MSRNGCDLYSAVLLRKMHDVAAFGPSDEAGRAMGKTMCLIRA